MEISAQPVAAADCVLDTKLDVMLSKKIFSVVRNVRLKRVPAGFLGLDIREVAVDTVNIPLLPVDITRMADAAFFGNVGFVIPPEAQIFCG